jgi:short-subunit dehydrogenase
MKGKVVWITGASSGIGESLVYAFAAKGAKLVLSARRTSELMRVKDKAQMNEEDVLILPLDIEKSETFDTAFQTVIARFNTIDILVNNAGISQRSLVKDTPLAVDKRLMDVNYIGTVALTKTVLPTLLKKHDGQIVVITSAVGKFGSPWRSGYSASKHALHGFFDAMRAELYNDNVKVLLVCPGFVRTNVSLNALNEKGEALQQMDDATAKGLSPDDVAHQILCAIEKGKEEIVIGGLKEKFGVWMKRHFPSVFSVMIRKMAVR